MEERKRLDLHRLTGTSWPTLARWQPGPKAHLCSSHLPSTGQTLQAQVPSGNLVEPDRVWIHTLDIVAPRVSGALLVG